MICRHGNEKRLPSHDNHNDRAHIPIIHTLNLCFWHAFCRHDNCIPKIYGVSIIICQRRQMREMTFLWVAITCATIIRACPTMARLHHRRALDRLKNQIDFCVRELNDTRSLSSIRIAITSQYHIEMHIW